MNLTVAELLDEASANLDQAPEPTREAQILLGHALGASRAWLVAHESEFVEPDAALMFRELVRRRQAGEPIAYLVGKKEFYGLDFRVTPDVLIPRADTESLVEAALEKITQAPDDVLDLGTGSGCVAIALAHQRPAAHVTAVDSSAAALRVARENADANGVQVEFVQSRWFDGLAGRRFHLIVSNPPYVAAQDHHLRQGDLRFEPLGALASGPDGLSDIRLIVGAAPAHLREGGWLLFEHGHDQACASRDLLFDAGFRDLLSRSDIAGISRVAGGRLLTLNSPNR